MADVFYRRPMPVQTHGPNDPVIGKRIALLTKPSGANLVALPTPLISAVVNEPRQWLVTIMQSVRTDSQVQPWLNNWDGAAVVTPSNVGTAPVLPLGLAGLAGGSGLQLQLRWAAGGASFTMRADYPLAGCVFGVCADSLDLSTVYKDNSAQSSTTYTPATVPIIGAFMVPGVAADPTPLQWREEAKLTATTVGRYWQVKNHARRLRIVVGDNVAPAAQDVTVTWEAASPAGVVVIGYTRYVQAASASLIIEEDVPPQANRVLVRNNSANTTPIFPTWLIGLT